MKHFLIIDDFYTLDEQHAIWQELDYYYQQQLFKADDVTGSKHGTATRNGKPLAQLNRIYLDATYPPEHRFKSNILNIYQKVASKEVVESYKRVTPAGNQFEITDNDCSVISYYDNGDKYDEHFDAFMHTAIIWFYKEPKKFEGGDFRLPELNETIECLHNRMIIFPSYYSHVVDELKLDEQYRNKGLGRFSITHFYNKSI